MTETQHVIALNPYRKGNKGKVFSNSMAVYDKVIASPEIRKMIQQIRGELPIPKVDANDAEAVKKAQDRLKSELPFFLSPLRHFQEQRAQTGECPARELHVPDYHRRG